MYSAMIEGSNETYYNENTFLNLPIKISENF